MLTRVTRDQATKVPMAGRVFYTFVAPATTPAVHLSMGVSVFEPGARPEGHVHETEEETIYCLSGRGRLVAATGNAEFEPGVVVHVEPGTFHATECDGPAPMELLCVFTPPVIPGTYEKKK